MEETLLVDVKKVILSTVGKNSKTEGLANESHLVGDLLDSLSITNLITALEENFGFIFDDEDLSAEAFDTPLSLTKLVASKLA